MIELQPEPSRSSPELNKALIEAVKNNHGETVKGLLSLSKENSSILDINAIDEKKYTPLHWAALQADDTITELLLNAGADPDKETIHGETALFLAAKSWHTFIAHLLLLHFANPNITNKITGETPWETAGAHSHKEVIELLLHFGCGIGKYLPQSLSDINTKYCFIFGMKTTPLDEPTPLKTFIITHQTLHFENAIDNWEQLQDYERKLTLLKSGQITENTDELRDVFISHLEKIYLTLKGREETLQLEKILSIISPTKKEIPTLKTILQEINEVIGWLPYPNQVSFRDLLFAIPYARLFPLISRIFQDNPENETLKTLFFVFKSHSQEIRLFNQIKKKIMSDLGVATAIKNNKDAPTILQKCQIPFSAVGSAIIQHTSFTLPQAVVTELMQTQPSLDPNNRNFTIFKLNQWREEKYLYQKSLRDYLYNTNSKIILNMSCTLLGLLLISFSCLLFILLKHNKPNYSSESAMLITMLIVSLCILVPCTLTCCVEPLCTPDDDPTVIQSYIRKLQSPQLVNMNQEQWDFFIALYRLLKDMQTTLLPNQCPLLDDIIRTLGRTEPPVSIYTLMSLLSNDLTRLFSGADDAPLLSAGLFLSQRYRDVHFYPPQKVDRLLPLPGSSERSGAESETDPLLSRSRYNSRSMAV